MIHSNHCHSLVYDFDCSLPLPCDFSSYSKQVLRDDDLLHEDYHRRFRVVSAHDYLEVFASDRSRMKNQTGEWIKPPPQYPCIQTNESSNNLDDFICMDNKLFHVGEILTLKQLNTRFGLAN